MTAEIGPRSLIASQEEAITFRRSLTRVVGDMRNNGICYHDAVRQFEAAYVKNVLAVNRGHLGNVAVQLGMHRNTLTRTMRVLDLKKRDVAIR
jgi:Fis family transcriptional regulator